MNQKMSSLPPLKTWQFFHACRKVLGDTFLVKVYMRGQRQIYRWAADPDFTSNHERNPLDRFKMLLDRLCEIGREDIALSAVEMLAESIGYEAVRNGNFEPDQDNLEGECLDDYPALTNFHAAIRERHPIEEIRHLSRKAKREIDETLALVWKDRGDKP